MSTDDACGEGGSLRLIGSGKTAKDDYAQWATQTPPSILITNAYIASDQVLISPRYKSLGYHVAYLWSGGSKAITDTGTRCCGGMDYGTGIDKRFSHPLRWFVIQVSCVRTECGAVSGQVLDIKGVKLTAVDDTAPRILPAQTAANIAIHDNRWVRGSWNASFTARAGDGVCRSSVSVNGRVVARGPSYTPVTGSWIQCGSGAGTQGGSGTNSVSHTIDTDAYGNGPMTVEYYAADASQSANVAAPSYHVNVDNSPVSLALDGPRQALASASPHLVRARASAGPSGVAGIACSVNGGPAQWHTGAAGDFDVSAIGFNTVACYARNNAVDASGVPARSPIETWSLDIRHASVSLISLGHLRRALRCRRERVRVRLRARWVTIRVRGQRIRVRVPGQRRWVVVRRCRTHQERREVRGNGHMTVMRGMALTHSTDRTHERIRFGARPVVSGWLGETDGLALGDQRLELLTAPANGSRRFEVVKTVITRPNGTWRARLPRGPSRLVEAVFSGNTQVAPVTSEQASIIVPAALSLRVAPHRTRWGDTIAISGRLRGGYVPSSGELVVLRIGWSGGSAEVGHVYTNRAGRFSANYTFLRGSGSETYRIWAQTIRESDYPFSTASSRRVRIHVG